MAKDLVNKTEKDFESIKHVDENGTEFWYARELMTMLEYSKWGNFKNVINKAKEACNGSNIAEEEHFADVRRVLKVGNNAEDDACKTHHKVGQAVRQTIKRIGGTMPEDLPTPSKSAKQIEKEKNKQIKAKDKKKLK